MPSFKIPYKDLTEAQRKEQKAMRSKAAKKAWAAKRESYSKDKNKTKKPNITHDNEKQIYWLIGIIDEKISNFSAITGISRRTIASRVSAYLSGSEIW